MASTADILPQPATEQAALVNNTVMGKCDTLKEGFLNNPRACKVDFSALRCKAGQSGTPRPQPVPA